VSSNLYNLQRREDIIRINVSNLQVPHDQVFMEFLASVNGTVVDNSANISGYTLCFNASTSVRDALVNAMIPVDTICGSCGETTHYCLVTVMDTSYSHTLYRANYSSKQLCVLGSRDNNFAVHISTGDGGSSIHFTTSGPLH
jgi:tRNA A37 threonylcarbamoyladenosine synthetase subunit TsaC/SUA5/YrdC